MFQRVLVVCVGNICRSPVAERLLAQSCPDLEVASAGLAPVTGAPIDPVAAEVAQAHGLRTAGHSARRFSPEEAGACDLILAMERSHIAEISRRAPELSGKTMLFARWLDTQEVPDPYKKPRAVHEAVFAQLKVAADAWKHQLEGVTNG